MINFKTWEQTAKQLGNHSTVSKYRRGFGSGPSFCGSYVVKNSVTTLGGGTIHGRGMSGFVKYNADCGL
jgi:hypothetical protein